MAPYMARGRRSIEDAAILSRCLKAGVDRDGIPMALATYEATRKERTARVQLTSAEQLGQGVTDTDWVYGYNAWTAHWAGDLLDDRALAGRARQ